MSEMQPTVGEINEGIVLLYQVFSMVGFELRVGLCRDYRVSWAKNKEHLVQLHIKSLPGYTQIPEQRGA